MVPLSPFIRINSFNAKRPSINFTDPDLVNDTTTSNTTIEINITIIENILDNSTLKDIIFNWNGEEYDLVLDASFWIQPYPVESFINKLSQHYANDVVITESQKIGFQPVKSKQHVDGSNTIILQRWNLNNSLSAV